MKDEEKRAAALNAAITYINLRLNILTAEGKIPPLQAESFDEAKRKIEMGSHDDVEETTNDFIRFIDNGGF